MTNSKSWSVEKEDDQVWDDLFPHRTENVGVYLNPEGPDGAMLDIGILPILRQPRARGRDQGHGSPQDS